MENVIIFNYGLIANNAHWKKQIPFWNRGGMKMVIHNYRGHSTLRATMILGESPLIQSPLTLRRYVMLLE